MVTLGPLHIYWYGMTIVFAVVLNLLLTWINARKRREDFSIVLDLFLYGIPCSIVCSRIFYVLLHRELFAADFSGIFNTAAGGLSIYGAFAGFLFSSIIYLHLQQESFWHWMDILLPGMIAGLIVNQFANFFMQNTIGLPLASVANDHSIAAYINFKERPTGFEHYLYFRPVALYQAGVLFFIFLYSLILTYLQTVKHKINCGNIFLQSAILIAACRFVFGFMYLSTQQNIIFHVGQAIPLLIIMAALVLYYLRRRNFYHTHTYHFE